MADTIYEYTDAQGGVHRVDDLSQVPKDRIRHMVAIGVDEAPQTAAVAAAPAAPTPKPQLPPAVWAVSGALLLGAFFSKRFLIRVFCGLTAVIYLLYHGWDLFQASGYTTVEERQPKPRAVVVQEE